MNNNKAKQNNMSFFIKKSFLIVISTITPALVFAADAPATPAAQQGYSFNAVLIGLLSLIVVLAFAIGLLASTFSRLGMVYRDKMREERSKSNNLKSIILLIVTAAITTGAKAQVAVIDSVATPSKPWFSTSVAGMNATEFYFLMGVIALELLVTVCLVFYIRNLIRLITEKPAVEGASETIAQKIRKPSFWNKFTNAVPVDREQDIMIAHDYDGIQELDNSLPPWWKYGFYLTIFTAVAYMWYYHGGGNGPTQLDEYATEVKAGEEAKAAYLASSANNVDENTVTMGDAAAIAEGKDLYAKNCVACHAADGGGGVGPNLTDVYWLHGGSIKDVFKTIKYGWPDKGMKSWKDDFSPKQIASIASFVESLKGSTPAAPKEKQGELFNDEGGNTAPATDSSSATVEK